MGKFSRDKDIKKILQNADININDEAIICPIASNMRPLNLRVLLDDRTQIQGDVICEQVRTIDLLARKHKVVEPIPKDLLKRVLEAVSVIVDFEDE